MIGVYGSFAQPDTFFSKVFAVTFMLSLIWLLYISINRPGVIHYPFNRIVELGPVICVWMTGSALSELIYSSKSVLGLWLCLLGIIWIPFAWSQIRERYMMGLLTSSYKSLNHSS